MKRNYKRREMLLIGRDRAVLAERVLTTRI